MKPLQKLTGIFFYGPTDRNTDIWGYRSSLLELKNGFGKSQKRNCKYDLATWKIIPYRRSVAQTLWIHLYFEGHILKLYQKM